jgi:hypothetical protein
MRLRLLFVVLVCALTVSVFAQTTNATGVITGNLLLSGASNTGNFGVGLDGGKLSGVNRKMGSVQVAFTIDTNCVDLIFLQYDYINGVVLGEVALSSLTNPSNALLAMGLITQDPTVVVKGSVAGTADNLGGGRYLVKFGIVGAAIADNAPLGRNPFVTGDPSAPIAIRYVTNNANIYAKPGHEYDIAATPDGMPINATTYYRTSKTANVNFNMTQGRYVATPEPGSIFAIFAGIGGLLALRRRK